MGGVVELALSIYQDDIPLYPLLKFAFNQPTHVAYTYTNFIGVCNVSVCVEEILEST